MPATGLTIQAVTVLSVDGNTAYVRSDHTGLQFPVARDILRAHATPPMAGERWILDKAYGAEWTFAAIVGGDPSTPLVAVTNAAERLALRAPYPNMAVYELSSFTVWFWNGTSWAVSAPPPAPESRQVACQVNFGSDAVLSAGNVTAQGGWNLVTNEGGYTFNLITGEAWIQVPSNGQYRASLKVAFAPYTSGGTIVHGCKIMKNGSDLTVNSIITDTKISVTTGEATWLDAWDEVPLLAGDKLYWQVYSSGSTTLLGAVFNVPTRIAVRRIGPN